MAIFISYSHADAEFVSKLAAQLVKSNAHIWVDSWELNVGDSILTRVQQAIQESSALLIVLSKASVQSEWCKKELNAGLMRELDEKRVVVLPVLVETCEIPIFLREKVYADFRTKFEVGLKALVEAVAKVTDADQGRLTTGTSNTDWAETWWYTDGLFCMEYTFIESSSAFAFTLLTQIHVTCNELATRKFEIHKALGLDWLGRLGITENVADLLVPREVRIRMEDQFPKIAKYRLQDRDSDSRYDIVISCRRMGENNGKDQLLNITNYVKQIRDHVRKTARKLKQEEAARLAEALAQMS